MPFRKPVVERVLAAIFSRTLRKDVGAQVFPHDGALPPEVVV